MMPTTGVKHRVFYIWLSSSTPDLHGSFNPQQPCALASNSSQWSGSYAHTMSSNSSPWSGSYVHTPGASSSTPDLHGRFNPQQPCALPSNSSPLSGSYAHAPGASSSTLDLHGNPQQPCALPSNSSPWSGSYAHTPGASSSTLDPRGTFHPQQPCTMPSYSSPWSGAVLPSFHVGPCGVPTPPTVRTLPPRPPPPPPPPPPPAPPPHPSPHAHARSPPLSALQLQAPLLQASPLSLQNAPVALLEEGRSSSFSGATFQEMESVATRVESTATETAARASPQSAQSSAVVEEPLPCFGCRKANVGTPCYLPTNRAWAALAIICLGGKFGTLRGCSAKARICKMALRVMVLLTNSKRDTSAQYVLFVICWQVQNVGRGV